MPPLFNGFLAVLGGIQTAREARPLARFTTGYIDGDRFAAGLLATDFKRVPFEAIVDDNLGRVTQVGSSEADMRTDRFRGASQFLLSRAIADTENDVVREYLVEQLHWVAPLSD